MGNQRSSLCLDSYCENVSKQRELRINSFWKIGSCCVSQANLQLRISSLCIGFVACTILHGMSGNSPGLSFYLLLFNLPEKKNVVSLLVHYTLLFSETRSLPVSDMQLKDR